MPSVRRLRLNFTGAVISGPAVSTFYFDASAGTAANAVTALQTFMTALRDQLHTTLSWQISNQIDTLDVVTGNLVSSESAVTVGNTGNNGFEPLPPSVQGRLDLLTGVVVGKRLLRGRIYIPGFTEGVNTGGVPVGSTQAVVNTAANFMRDDVNTNWQVWSRSHGTAQPVSSPVMWTKWGSLRSRRD